MVTNRISDLGFTRPVRSCAIAEIGDTPQLRLGSLPSLRTGDQSRPTTSCQYQDAPTLSGYAGHHAGILLGIGGGAALCAFRQHRASIAPSHQKSAVSGLGKHQRWSPIFLDIICMVLGFRVIICLCYNRVRCLSGRSCRLLM